MVVTGDPELAARIRILKDHAMDPARRYWHQEVGFNFRMTNLQAAIGCAQLERYGEMVGKRQLVLDTYREAFAGDLEIVLNPSMPWAEPAPWLVCVLLPDHFDGAKRDALMAALRSESIDTRPYFNLLCDMPPYLGEQANADHPVARGLAMRGLNLPSSSSLTRETIFHVAGVFRKALGDVTTS